MDSTVITKLQTWAAGQVLVKRLWVFGSRARGDNHARSDLDVAIEIHHHDESEGMATWMCKTQHWQGELASLFTLPVDLQQYQGLTATPIIHAALERSSQLIFERPEAAAATNQS